LYFGPLDALITATIGLKKNSAMSPTTLHSFGFKLYPYKHAMSLLSLL
jgi:hypothetical protein